MDWQSNLGRLGFSIESVVGAAVGCMRGVGWVAWL